MCQGRLISCNKCPAMVGDVDHGGRAEGIWELSIPSSQFCFEPKLVDNMVSSLRVAGCAGERVCWQAEGWTRPMGLGEEARVAAC